LAFVTPSVGEGNTNIPWTNQEVPRTNANATGGEFNSYSDGYRASTVPLPAKPALVLICNR
jgi:hypothetical protein